MGIRAIAARAIVVPLGVALASVAALGWYGFVRIPAQQAYLNERNLRVLRTRSTQLAAKIDGFDRNLDHAIAFTSTAVGDYMPKVDHDVEILTEAEDGDREHELREAATDPPTIAIRRDEGTNYLYLSLKAPGGAPAIVERAKIDDIAASYLDVGSEFDAVMLVDGGGRVLEERSPSGLMLSRIDVIVNASQSSGQKADERGDDRAASGDREKPARAGAFESLRATTNVLTVPIGGAAYNLYMQPVQLSLLAAPASKEHSDISARQEELWVLCGLVRADHLRAETTAISYTYVLWFTAALAAIWLAIPLVKLRVIEPNERLRNVDAIRIGVSVLIGAGLLTLGALDIYAFRVRFNNAIDDRLEAVAGRMARNLVEEVASISTEMQSLHKRAIGLAALAPPGQVKAALHWSPGRAEACGRKDACAGSILKALVDGDGGGTDPQPRPTIEYPFFDLVVWNTREGNQTTKWTTGADVTPFINLKEEAVPYFPDLQRALQFESGADETGISVFPSPNTANQITVFWTVVTGPSNERLGESLTTSQPLTLDHPIVPYSVRFAVVDGSGRVLFHSDGKRSVGENFLQECENDPNLESAVAGRYDAHFTAYYRGRPQRMFVTPLLNGAAFRVPDWSLVVFQDNQLADTMNLETLTLALMLLGAFGLLALIVAWLVRRHAAGDWTASLWPDGRRHPGYLAAARSNGMIILVFLLATLVLNGIALLLVAATLMIAGGIITYRLVGRRPLEASVHPNVWPTYYAAAATLMFVMAALPAIAAFDAAYAYELRLLTGMEQWHLGHDLVGRTQRLQTATMSLPRGVALARQRVTCDRVMVPLFGDAQESPDTCGSSLALKSGETNGLAQPAVERIERAAHAGASRFDAVLDLMHRSYNDTAVDLRAAADAAPSVPPPGSSVPLGWLALIALSLLGLFYALLRVGVHPLFAPDAWAPRAINPDAHLASDTRILLIGPPGSGKTSRLTREAMTRVFDVRTQGYVERRLTVRSVPVERRGEGTGQPVSVPALVAAAVGVTTEVPPVKTATTLTTNAKWAETFDYSTLPPNPATVIVVDHLDHRMEEPEFREQTLVFLETLVYRYNRIVQTAAERDPLAIIAETPAPKARRSTNEVSRWGRVLQSFRRERSGIGDALLQAHVDKLRREAEENPIARVLYDEGRWSPQLMRVAEDLLPIMPARAPETPSAIRREFGVAAESYYQVLWGACSTSERLALRQLAEEALVNPRNGPVLRQLLRSGLMVRDPNLRLMNETFRRFVLRAASSDDVSEWERAGVRLPWISIETALVTVVAGLAGLLIITQQQLLTAWIGFVPALAPAVPTVWKVITGAQRLARGQAPFEATA